MTEETANSTQLETSNGNRAADLLAISTVLALCPHNKAASTLLSELANGHRQERFDPADAVCFERDAFNKRVTLYLGILDESDKIITKAVSDRLAAIATP